MDATEFGVGSPAYVAIRAANLFALVWLIGAQALRWTIVPRAFRGATASPALAATIEANSLIWMRAAIALAGVATLLRLVAQHMAIFGGGERPTAQTVGALLLHSTWGLAWLVAAGATVVGACALRGIRRGWTLGWPSLGTATVVLIVASVTSGHAAAAPAPADAILLQSLHFISAGGWIGGLAALVLLAIPAALRDPDGDGHARVGDLVRALSPAALSFAGVLTITGLAGAWRQLGGVATLWTSGYGRVLLAKVALLAVTAGAAAFNWRWVLPTLGDAAATRRLRRSAAVELSAAVLILIVTAVLVAFPTPGEGVPDRP